MVWDTTEEDKFSTRMKVTKKNYFQNQRTAYIKTPKDLQGTSGVRINNKSTTVVEWYTSKNKKNST